jgi:hypothetical protein
VKIEQTPQQRDPLGTYSTWLLAPVAAGVAVAYAFVSTLEHLDQIVNPVLAILAVLLAVVASAVLVRGALPSRSPFRRTMLVLVVASAVAGAVCFNAATWGQNRMIQDDWGHVVVAVLIVAMAQLRPPVELAVAALLRATVLGLSAAVQGGFLVVTVNPLVYAIVAAKPPALLGLGAATYSRNMLRATASWRRRASAGMAELEPQVREFVTRSVQQRYVTVLNREAVPLFERVLLQGEITALDADVAATVARDLRSQAIGMLHTSWLDDVIERAQAVRNVPIDIIGDRTVIDAVDLDQRAVFAATVLDIVDASEYPLERITISARPIEGSKSSQGRTMARLELVADAELTAVRVMRARLMPYLAVLRVISDAAALHVTEKRIEIGFSHDLA